MCQQKIKILESENKWIEAEVKINSILTQRNKDKYYQHYVDKIGDPTGPFKDLKFIDLKPNIKENISYREVIKMAKRYWVLYGTHKFHQKSVLKNNYSW